MESLEANCFGLPVISLPMRLSNCMIILISNFAILTLATETEIQ